MSARSAYSRFKGSGVVDIWQYEREAWAIGRTDVAGVDEVGRGPLAGPVVACAVILPTDRRIPEVNDSKRLTRAIRERLSETLLGLAGIRVGLGVVEPATIDKLNILRATHLAMRQALHALDSPAGYALVDGRPVPNLPVPSRSIVKGDALSASIAAASIIAKVHRDALMVEYDRQFPGYGFASHKGYGTAAHLSALQRLGPCPIHRRSFNPVARAMAGVPRQPEFDF